MEDGLDVLRAAVRGPVLLPGEPGSAKAAGRVWAVSPFLKRLPEPAVVVQPRGTSDVVAAIKWATQQGLPMAVKCGGHGGGNPCCVDGGLMIDMSQMRSVFVDPVLRTAVVDGGCLASDVDDETALHGLAAPLGICPSVGVGGLALNGGVSLLSRFFGPTCDNILEAQMVLADGSVVNVTPNSDPELWWAIRGAGTALGVVTKLKLQLHDVSGAYSGSLVWADDAEHNTYRAILRWMRDTVLPRPDIGFNFVRGIDPAAGPVLVAMVVMLGDAAIEEGEALIQPLRDLGPVEDTVGKSSWRETQGTHGPAGEAITAHFPVHYECWCGGHMNAEQFNDAFIDEWLHQTCDALPVPDCALTVSFFELGGGKLKETSGPMGFRADIQWVSQVGWADPACHTASCNYASSLREALAPYTNPSSGYINMLDMAECKGLSSEEASARVGGADRLECLRAVKARVDPGNLFRATPHSLVLAASTGLGREQ